MTTEAMTKVQLTVNVGSTPIAGWVDDDRGRHGFAGWLELVTIVAAAVAPRPQDVHNGDRPVTGTLGGT